MYFKEKKVELQRSQQHDEKMKKKENSIRGTVSTSELLYTAHLNANSVFRMHFAARDRNIGCLFTITYAA
jgi:hypothetical protein